MKTKNGLPYVVAADGRENPGKVTAIVVELTKHIYRPDELLRIDLAAHPLYPHLWEYCRTNLPRKPKDGAQ